MQQRSIMEIASNQALFLQDYIALKGEIIDLIVKEGDALYHLSVFLEQINASKEVLEAIQNKLSTEDHNSSELDDLMKLALHRSKKSNDILDQFKHAVKLKNYEPWEKNIIEDILLVLYHSMYTTTQILGARFKGSNDNAPNHQVQDENCSDKQ